MTTQKPASSSSNILLILLIVALAAAGALLYLVLRPGEEKQEAVAPVVPVVEARDVEETPVSVTAVIDAIERVDVSAEEGQRYKVLITEQARDGSSGIARIGGLVTFVANAEVGDVAVIEVTSLKRTTADAVVIELLERGYPVPARAERPRREEPVREERARDEEPASDLVGQTFRGTITDTGREGDGVTYLNGKVVFVAGAEKGEDVQFRITEDRGRFANAVVVQRLSDPDRDTGGIEKKPYVHPVASGEEYEVEITEADRRNPGRDGVTRINNMVVFVPDTAPGDRVRIRITGVQRRAADAEVLERLGAGPVEP